MKILYILFLFSSVTLAQKANKAYKVLYNNSGKNIEITYSNQVVYLSQNDAKIKKIIKLSTAENISTINVNNKNYCLVTPFDKLPQPSLENKTQKILGYSCKLATYNFFSNTIDVWYTEATKAKGTPYSNYLPNKNALVLKVVINNSRVIEAKSIKKLKKNYPIPEIANNAIAVTNAEFEELKINSRFYKINVFKEEIVNYNNNIVPDTSSLLQTNKTYHFSKGSVLLKKIKIANHIKNSGYVFANLKCKSNGDAYDRTGSVFIIPVNKKKKISLLNAFQHGIEQLPVYTDKNKKNYQGIVTTENYDPPIELMRFFTSFGANHFNKKREINNYKWAKNVSYKQDVSSLIPLQDDEIWVGVFIGNYDKGGHIVSLDLDFYPPFNHDVAITNSKYIQPLFSTVNTLEMSGQNYGRLFKTDTLKLSFELPKKVEQLQLLYTATGHGGWGEGDEFTPKLNEVFIDGIKKYSVVPWRTDCASYRMSNPASGNFVNGLSSSDLSRSNWCPATVSPPYYIPLTNLKAGKHTIEIVIDQGDDKGNSFNHWNISGVLVGEISP